MGPDEQALLLPYSENCQLRTSSGGEVDLGVKLHPPCHARPEGSEPTTGYAYVVKEPKSPYLQHLAWFGRVLFELPVKHIRRAPAGRTCTGASNFMVLGRILPNGVIVSRDFWTV